MKSVRELMEEGITSSRLNILVFGPQVKNLALDERIRNLQLKRAQIREELEKDGHNVKYGEDLFDSTLPPPLNNVMVQEKLMMKEYDMIVNLVESSGSTTEATMIAENRDFSLKTALFMDIALSDTMAAEVCRWAAEMGATFTTYRYPVDLIECHLLGFVKEKVRKFQAIHFLSR